MGGGLTAAYGQTEGRTYPDMDQNDKMRTFRSFRSSLWLRNNTEPVTQRDMHGRSRIIPEFFIFCRMYYYILYTGINIYYDYYKNIK